MNGGDSASALGYLVGAKVADISFTPSRIERHELYGAELLLEDGWTVSIGVTSGEGLYVELRQPDRGAAAR